MSRVGKAPIPVPDGVEVRLGDGACSVRPEPSSITCA